MTPPILVTGGTGTLGRHVVRRLRDAGHEIRVLSRHGRSSEDGIEYVTADLLKGRVRESSPQWTTLRAAQFHDLLLMTAQQMAKVPVMPVPAGFRFQPVDADEVAARLVELTLGPPAGLVPDMGGPRVYAMADLLRGYLRACGKHRVMLPVWAPGRAARAFRSGANLAPERAVGQRPWEDFLAERMGSPGDRKPGVLSTH